MVLIAVASRRRLSAACARSTSSAPTRRPRGPLPRTALRRCRSASTSTRRSTRRRYRSTRARRPPQRATDHTLRFHDDAASCSRTFRPRRSGAPQAQAAATGPARRPAAVGRRAGTKPEAAAQAAGGGGGSARRKRERLRSSADRTTRAAGAGERQKPRAPRPDPGRPAGRRRVRRRPHRRVEPDQRHQPDLRRLLPGRLRGRPHLHPHPAAVRRPVPVPAVRAAWPRSGW